MTFNTRFNPPPSKGVEFKDETLTQQEYREVCDINAMIRRAVGGDASVFRHPVYADVLAAPDSAHDVANRLSLANSIWHDMPERVRQTYGSPEALLNAIDNSQKPVEKTEINKDKEVRLEKTASATEAPTPSNT